MSFLIKLALGMSVAAKEAGAGKAIVCSDKSSSLSIALFLLATIIPLILLSFSCTKALNPTSLLSTT